MEHRLVVHVDLDDLIVFNRHYVATSPTIRRNIRFAHVGGSLFIWGVMFAMIHLIDGLGLLLTLAAASLGALVFAVLFPRKMKQQLAKQVVGSIKRDGHKGVLGIHTLTLDDDGILETNERGELFVKWDAVGSVERNGDRTHAFIFIGPGLAHVIPLEGVREGDVDRFLAEVVDRRDAHR